MPEVTLISAEESRRLYVEELVKMCWERGVRRLKVGDVEIEMAATVNPALVAAPAPLPDTVAPRGHAPRRGGPLQPGEKLADLPDEGWVDVLGSAGVPHLRRDGERTITPGNELP